MHAKTATSIATERFAKQSATIRSIIEPNPSPDDDAFAGIYAALDNGVLSLLMADLDVAAFKGPGRDLDENACAVIVHDKCRRRHHDLRDHRRREARIGKHVGLELHGRIVECDADLGTPGVGLEHVADEQHLSVEGLAG